METVNHITIKGQKIPVVDCDLKQAELMFYPENPRIYSLVCIDGEIPEQPVIEERLCDKEHVLALFHSIKANGGVIDPLIVGAKGKVVYEGNSRLAAYRLLAKENAVEWGKVRCRVLPEDIDDSLIFALLGQYHIIGRQDWAPFEQAGYIVRRIEKYDTSVDDLSKEIGVPAGTARRLVKVYRYMREKNDNSPQHWSYYDEFLKIPATKLKVFHELETTVVEQIKKGRIPKAEDIRKLKTIVSSKGKFVNKIVKAFVNNKKSLNDVYDDFLSSGAGDGLYKKMNSFRSLVLSPDTRESINEMGDRAKKKIKFELKKIKPGVNNLLEMFEK